jgi:hypothetical protein
VKNTAGASGGTRPPGAEDAQLDNRHAHRVSTGRTKVSICVARRATAVRRKR